MKKTIKAIAFNLIFLCAITLPSKLAAQVPGPGPYDIWNFTNCSMDFRWDVMDNTCGSVCIGSGGIVSVVAGGNITITAAMIAAAPCGGGACDVIITMLGPTGNNFPSAYFFNAASPTTGSVVENDCNSAPYTYNWLVTPTVTNFW